ncbi:hypothetical protein [Serratia fonticola]|uniref:hypothetical protein n=1 Tax=Serratia fonticola TaxID=47917 RepID=UPI003BB71200
MNEKDPPSIILPVASSIIAGRMNNRNKWTVFTARDNDDDFYSWVAVRYFYDLGRY